MLSVGRQYLELKKYKPITVFEELFIGGSSEVLV